MQKYFRLVAAAAMVGLAVWAWNVFFPSPERAIRSQLNNLAKSVSFEPNSGLVARGYGAQKATGIFATNAEVNVDVRGYRQIALSGRDEILQGFLMAAKTFQGLKIEFTGLVITVAPDKQTAVVDLTGKGTVSGERNFEVQEFNFYFRKVDGEWQIYKVESVKTLSLLFLAKTGHDS
jgi:hypothetical protein